MPVRWPGKSCSWTCDGDVLGENFRQLRPGIIVSKKALTLLDMPTQTSLITYEPPKDMEIMDPETLMHHDYFSSQAKIRLQALQAGRLWRPVLSKVA